MPTESRPPVSRVFRSKAAAQASYDRLSRWYDLLAGSSERKYKEAGLRLLHAAAGENILEIGYGTGEIIKALAQAVGTSGQVFGIDLSPGMFKVAGEKVRAAGLAGNVHLTCGDAARLPFAGGFFDAIYMSFTLELFDTPEIPLVLSECRRVLRSDGRISIVAMAKKEKSGWMSRLYEWAHANFEQAADCRPIYLREALQVPGFQITAEAEMSMFGLPVDIAVARKVS